MKRYEAIFKSKVYRFEATDPQAANELAKKYRDKHFPTEKFKLIQIGL